MEFRIAGCDSNSADCTERIGFCASSSTRNAGTEYRLRIEAVS